ncbi:hypothetical protein GOP47_0004957 [Adiantum capillus-veneris]|uniref:Phytocyanin domain-containing protein n=1 Tax=Adiantum capillus-veneris TaxID=13818 RepID=A0A9D4ZKY5_ADICA|nr:hypothetical protein GOP47_0004957 [Adiantum capillus-veneris]
MGGGCVVVMVALVMCLLVLGTEETTWKVGDSKGWQLNVDYAQWSRGKLFVAGDFLLFTYDKNTENVLEVSAADYASCTTIAPIAAYSDGNTTVLLANYGRRFFISGIPGHCLASMTLQIHESPEPVFSPLSPLTIPPVPSLSPPHQESSPPSALPRSARQSSNL